MKKRKMIVSAVMLFGFFLTSSMGRASSYECKVENVDGWEVLFRLGGKSPKRIIDLSKTHYRIEARTIFGDSEVAFLRGNEEVALVRVNGAGVAAEFIEGGAAFFCSSRFEGEPIMEHVAGPAWEQVLTHCDQEVEWPDLDTYKYRPADYYLAEYLCPREQGRNSAVLTAIESRDCENNPSLAYLDLFWTCPSSDG